MLVWRYLYIAIFAIVFGTLPGPLLFDILTPIYLPILVWRDGNFAGSARARARSICVAGQFLPQHITVRTPTT